MLINRTTEVTVYSLATLEFQLDYLICLSMFIVVRVYIRLYRPGRFPVDTSFERQDLESCREAPIAAWYLSSRTRRRTGQLLLVAYSLLQQHETVVFYTGELPAILTDQAMITVQVNTMH